MTRRTHEYGTFYSHDAVGSYDDLVRLGMRTKSKELASDYEVLAWKQAPQLREITLSELREELQSIAREQVAGYDVMERRAAFSVLNAIERCDATERVRTSRDWHEMLKRELPLRAHVREIQELGLGEDLFVKREPAKKRARGHRSGR